MSKEWNCPRCGQKTSGSQSKAGLTWALCPSCMQKEQDEIRRERKLKSEDKTKQKKGGT